jgi:tRNA (guanine-N7-)-methyltransferase
VELFAVFSHNFSQSRITTIKPASLKELSKVEIHDIVFYQRTCLVYKFQTKCQIDAHRHIVSDNLSLLLMAQKKLVRFEELKTFENVLQFPPNMPGKWNERFKNNHPIILELACGKGEYAVGLGRLYPFKNFIGIDLKGNRLWVGAKKALQDGLRNVAFLRTQIDQIGEYFSKNEVAEIWITFPDPQLRVSKAKKRLTHPKFLRLYQQFLVAGGSIHLKTDSPDLYQFTRQVIEMYGCTLYDDDDNVHDKDRLPDELKIKTHYESLDIAGTNRIHYLRFSLPASLPGKEKDEELKQALKAHAGAD